MSYNILFVCSGNTCRSPMAAYLGGAVAEELFPLGDYRFDSAGIATGDGYPASENAVAVMAERGIDISGHRSKRYQYYMNTAADLVVCMTPMHRAALCREYPDFAAKFKVIGEVSGTGKEIPDPYLGSVSLYRHTREALEREITALLKNIDKNRKNGEEQEK